MSQGIILLGIKHCGKSTLGRMLGKHFHCSFYDTDDIISQITNRSPREIYQTDGAQAFMEAETHACDYLAEQLFSSKETEYVIATGGGICNNKEALAILQKLGFFFYLEVPKEVATQRIVNKIHWENGVMQNLPAYVAKENPVTIEDVAEIFGRFYDTRTAQYRKLAQIICKLTEGNPEENCKLVIDTLFSQDCRWD